MGTQRIVYFAGAIRGDRVLSSVIQELIWFIQKAGHEVLTEHIAADDPMAAQAMKLKVSPAQLSATDIEMQDIAWLDSATHVIAEISGASTGTGREIEYARTKGQLGKIPASILCLYRSDREFQASPMIRGMSADRYPNVTIAAYAAVEDAKKIITSFLE